MGDVGVRNGGDFEGIYSEGVLKKSSEAINGVKNTFFDLTTVQKILVQFRLYNP